MRLVISCSLAGKIKPGWRLMFCFKFRVEIKSSMLVCVKSEMDGFLMKFQVELERNSLSLLHLALSYCKISYVWLEEDLGRGGLCKMQKQDKD